MHGIPLLVPRLQQDVLTWLNSDDPVKGCGRPLVWAVEYKV